jgi:hypothetical protein
VKPLTYKMFRALRIAPAVRAALGLAVLLSLGSSIGLHPEPVTPSGSSGAPTVALAGAEAASHHCLACLTFGTTLVTRSAAIPHAGDCARFAGPRPEPASLCRMAGRDLPGRSPPVPA